MANRSRYRLDRSPAGLEALEPRVLLSGSESIPDDRYEDNDNRFITRANIGRDNSSALGTLSDPVTIDNLSMNDTGDWYRFKMDGYGLVGDFVRINFDHDRGDLQLKVYRADGKRLIGESTGTGDSETVSLEGAHSGTLWVRVYGRGFVPNPNYSLTIDAADPVADDDFESNDRVIDVRNLETGDTSSNLGLLTERTVLSGLAMADRADYYQFEMNAAGTSAHSIKLLFDHGRGDLQLKVYDERGRVRYGQSLSRTDNEAVSLEGLEAGVYTIRVYGRGFQFNPSYTLDITPAYEEPTIPEVVQPADDAYEDNDTRGRVAAMTPGSANSANLGTITETTTVSGLVFDDNADYFLIDLGFWGTGKAHARIDFNANQGQLALSLENADGQNINPPAAWMDSGTGWKSQNLRGLGLGDDVFLKVSRVSGTGPIEYSLTIDTGSMSPFVGDDAYEATFAEVQTHVPGDPGSANLGLTGDRLTGLVLNDTSDVFRFSVEPGTSQVTVTIAFNIGLGDLDLAIATASGAPLAWSTGAGDAESITFDPAGQTEFYIVVTGYAGDTNPSYSLVIDRG